MGGLVLVDGLEGHEAPGGDQLRLELEVDALPGQRVTRQALQLDEWMDERMQKRTNERMNEY